MAQTQAAWITADEVTRVVMSKGKESYYIEAPYHKGEAVVDRPQGFLGEYKITPMISEDGKNIAIRVHGNPGYVEQDVQHLIKAVKEGLWNCKFNAQPISGSAGYDWEISITLPDAAMNAAEAYVADVIKDLVSYHISEGSKRKDYFGDSPIDYETVYSVQSNEKAFRALEAVAELHPGAFTKANWDLLQQKRHWSINSIVPTTDSRDKSKFYTNDWDSIKDVGKKLNEIISQAEEIFRKAESVFAQEGLQTQKLDNLDQARQKRGNEVADLTSTSGEVKTGSIESANQETAVAQQVKTLVDIHVDQVNAGGGIMQTEDVYTVKMNTEAYNGLKDIASRNPDAFTKANWDLLQQQRSILSKDKSFASNHPQEIAEVQRIISQTEEVFKEANPNVDKAALALPPGGIDLNQINILRKGKTVNVQFDPAQLNELMQGGVEGFTPVIINMTHISSPFQLLGINPAKGLEALAKA